MHLIAVLSGVACAGAIALAPLSPKRDRRDCMFLAVTLLAAWAVSNEAWLLDSLEKLAVMDGAILALSVVLIRHHPSGWRLWFAGMALAQMALDMLYAWNGPAFYPVYWVLYDLSFLGEIIAVGWGGGVNVLVAFRRVFRTSRIFLPFKLVQKVGA